MNVTAIYVEIFITGIQSSIWLLLLIFAFFGIDFVNQVPDSIGDWSGLAIIVITSVIYTLGIFVDRAAIGFFSIINPKKILLKINWLSKTVEKASKNYHIDVLVREGEVSKLLELNRIRARIARSTAFNMVLLTISCLLFLQLRCAEIGCYSKPNMLLIALTFGIILVILSTIFYGLLEVSHQKDLDHAKTELKKIKKKS